MIFARRTALLRLTAMTALLASAVLTADHMNPGRAFCPLAEACAAASNSLLGSFNGIPTSVLGMIAFGSLFLLTLLPVEWARPLLRPAGFVAALAGIAFVAYQVHALDAFCPLCLVADGAGFFAGIITLTWPQPPVMRTGRRLPGEPLSSAAAWTFATMLVVIVPFAWPRDEEPAWVEIAPMDELAFEDEQPAKVEPTAPPPVIAVAVKQESKPRVEGVTILASASDATAPDATAEGPSLEPIVGIRAVEAPALPRVEPALGPAPAVGSTPPATAAEPARPPVTAAAPSKARQETVATTSAATKASKPKPKGPLLVEYLNAFCPHCRMTLKRLEGVLEESAAPVRKRRVYTWSSNDYPVWVRACAYAQTVGCEEEMFRELLKARNQSRQEVFAAARRAGLDTRSLAQAVSAKKIPTRLKRDRRIVQRARLRMLPTIDIGRRRLQGEQSSSELREALEAATRAHRQAAP